MPKSQLTKGKTIAKQQIHATDTGSPEVQISLLTESISLLTTHLKTNPKDFSSRRGLLKQVGKRKSLLRYLLQTSPARYKKTVAANNLKATA
jgi:small subunit ribosomal protein S15